MSSIGIDWHCLHSLLVMSMVHWTSPYTVPRNERLSNFPVANNLPEDKARRTNPSTKLLKACWTSNGLILLEYLPYQRISTGSSISTCIGLAIWLLLSFSHKVFQLLPSWLWHLLSIFISRKFIGNFVKILKTDLRRFCIAKEDLELDLKLKITQRY